MSPSQWADRVSLKCPIGIGRVLTAAGEGGALLLVRRDQNNGLSRIEQKLDRIGLDHDLGHARRQAVRPPRLQILALDLRPLVCRELRLRSRQERRSAQSSRLDPSWSALRADSSAGPPRIRGGPGFSHQPRLNGGR